MRASGLAMVLLTVLVAVAGCGGSSGPSGSTMEGSIDRKFITSKVNTTTYPLDIYLPPASAGSRAALPVVYALDGEWRFAELVSIAESTHARIIIVAIGDELDRGRDYVPPNTCTPGGGGHVAFFDFIRTELIPLVEGTVGGDPARCILLGHSHGGAFVLYALFAEAPDAHHFQAYLASDASIWCMPATVADWEQSYAAAYTALPVRLHISDSGNIENTSLAQRLSDHHYTGLTVKGQSYPGGHTGMIPAAFQDAIQFALSSTN